MALLGQSYVTGMLCAAPMMASPGGVAVAMTVGTATVDLGIAGFLYVDGFSTFYAIGSLSPALFEGATISELFWASSTNHSANGTMQITVSGNRSAGFITDVTSDGVSLGAVVAQPYDSGTNTTSFNLGSAGSANPFGTSGNRAIVIS